MHFCRGSCVPRLVKQYGHDAMHADDDVRFVPYEDVRLASMKMYDDVADAHFPLRPYQHLRHMAVRLLYYQLLHPPTLLATYPTRPRLPPSPDVSCGG